VNPNPFDVLSDPVLFVDDALIASKRGVTRTVHPGRKHDTPVLRPNPDKPWEHGGEDQSKRVHLYGTTMYDESVGVYRMWYMCRMGPHWRFRPHTVPGLYIPRPGRNPSTYMGQTHDAHGRKFVENDRGDLTCYAESDDGLTWTKPNLGIFEFNGSRDNNIVWDLHGASVFRDDDEPDPRKRYQAIGFCRRYRAVFLLTSPDGVRWDDSSHVDPVAERENEGSLNVVYDDRGRVYRAYAHARGTDRDARRMVHYTEASRLSGPWAPLRPILGATPDDDAVGAQKYGATRAEIHNMSGFRYHGIHIGIAGTLYVTGHGAAEHEMPVDGPIDAHLIYSDDGVNWKYPDAEPTPILPRGEPGAFDGGMIMGTATQPIIRGDEIHWYYTGARHTHGRPLHERYKAIGRATWRLDGFVSLDAGATAGVVETVPMATADGDLCINADARGGSIAVEVLGPDGHPQPGFSADDCVPFSGDSVRHPVRWKCRTLADASRPLRLRFVLHRAALYAFRGAAARSSEG
jgi:hypothetical protein